MEITRITHEIEWMVNVNGLSYVRWMRGDNIGWKQNFSYTPDIENDILSYDQLEREFHKVNIKKLESLYSYEGETVTGEDLNDEQG